MKLTDNIEDLKEISRRMRIDILKMLHESGSGHSGSSLSCIDILVAIYCSRMDHSPDRKREERRDRFVMSKGHGAPALYAVLAECGYFGKENLLTLRKLKSKLSGHPYSGSTPGVEVTTGSLGQGLSQANGLAIANRLNGEDTRVYCLLGDGEVQEGQVWEAAMSAAHYKLGSIIAIVDHNQLQIDGAVDIVKNIEPLSDKWVAFGWHVQDINGHDFRQILDAIDAAKAEKNRPSLINAHTVKGKGVSFMEGVVKWHGAVPGAEELEKALEELSAPAEDGK